MQVKRYIAQNQRPTGNGLELHLIDAKIGQETINPKVKDIFNGRI